MAPVWTVFVLNFKLLWRSSDTYWVNCFYFTNGTDFFIELSLFSSKYVIPVLLF